MQVVLIIIYLMLTLAGLLLMKKGGNSGSFSMNDGDIVASINWISLIGFICYIGSFLLFTQIITMFDLSYIMPLVTGIVQAATVVFGHFLFKEQLSLPGVIGITMIIFGIIIMNLKFK